MPVTDPEIPCDGVVVQIRKDSRECVACGLKVEVANKVKEAG